jgi:nitrate reductase NapAB chaperone NapD
MNKTTLIALGLSACLAFTATSLLAQEKPAQKPAPAAEGGGHSHFTKIPATVEEIWKEIHKQQGKLVAVVAAKDLGEAHDHAFAIRDLVKALPAKVSAEHKAKAEAGAKEITKLAADIDKSGAAGAQKATEANVKKMDAAIAALQASLKTK